MSDDELRFDDWQDDLDGKFALQVVGDNMAPDHIVDGDHVIIDKRSKPREGQIVAVRNEEEAILGRFHAHDLTGHFLLCQSVDPSRRVLRETGDILGTLVGVVRKY